MVRAAAESLEDMFALPGSESAKCVVRVGRLAGFGEAEKSIPGRFE